MPEYTLGLRRDVLYAWLRVSGYNQAELARALKISEGRISQLLRSTKEEPSTRLMAGLLRVTSLPFDRLFSLNPNTQVTDRRMRPSAGHRRRQRRSVARTQQAPPEGR